MNKNLLFEIGTEEIPARFISNTKKQMTDYLKTNLEKLKLNYEQIEIKCTPRRFAIFIYGIDQIQPDSEESFKGPAKKIAYDEQGNLSKALAGFIKSKGATQEDLYFKASGKDEYAYVDVKTKGSQTKDLLKDLFEGMIRSISFPKSMRWGGKDLKFVRPIRWLICLMDDEVIPFDIEGIKTGNVTRGHRFLGKSEIIINSESEYEQRLYDNFVILDDEKRKQLILSQCEDVADSIDGQLMMDSVLLEEVNYIIEYPTAFYGEFDEKYLHLPPEAVITPMKEHQRYFPVTDRSGKLLNKFITVRNGDSYRIDQVKKGNEKVLEARLSDALFFYNEDTKKPLSEFVENLHTIVFQQKLGTLFEKTERIRNLSARIAGLLEKDLSDLDRAAMLSKADLTSSVVFEFPELQGIMGRYYALSSGENEKVAEAINQHYLPRFAGDELPSTDEAVIIALADRLDSLAGFYAIGITPTGSQDPYALRRQALAVLNIMMDKKLDVTVSELIGAALENFGFIDFDSKKVKNELEDFFELRFKNILSDLDIRYDVIDAVNEVEKLNPDELLMKAKELDSWVKNHEITEVLNAFSRVCNITKKEVSGKGVSEELFSYREETELWAAFKGIKEKVELLTKEKEYIAALELLVSIKDEIDAFFDNVMIMDEDMDVRQNRLSMLCSIRDTMKNVADLSKIVNS